MRQVSDQLGGRPQFADLGARQPVWSVRPEHEPPARLAMIEMAA